MMRALFVLLNFRSSYICYCFNSLQQIVIPLEHILSVVFSINGKSASTKEMDSGPIFHEKLE